MRQGIVLELIAFLGFTFAIAGAWKKPVLIAPLVAAAVIYAWGNHFDRGGIEVLVGALFGILWALFRLRERRQAT